MNIATKHHRTTMKGFGSISQLVLTTYRCSASEKMPCWVELTVHYFFRQSIRRQGHKARKSKKGKDLSLLERCNITFLTSRVKRSRYHKYPKVCFSSRQSKHLGTRTLPDVVSAESYSKHPTTRVTSSRKLTWAENQGWSWLGGVSLAVENLEGIEAI